MGGLVLAGNTSGSTTVQATDAVTATITLPSATGTVQLSGAAASFTSLGVGAVGGSVTANDLIVTTGSTTASVTVGR